MEETQVKRRARQPRPQWSFAGLDAEKWRADTNRVRWAQTEPMFRDILTVLINERLQSHMFNQAGGHSEGFHLGVVRGFETAVQVVQSLAGGNPPKIPSLDDPDYTGD
jgi:hypothetical protein